MKKINIFSNYEFLIEINDKNFLIDELNNIEILDLNKDLFLKVYPINQTNLSIPFCLKLYIKNNTLCCDNKLCKIFNLKDRYDLFINPFTINNFVCLYTQTHTVKNTKYIICCYQDHIKISCPKGEFIYEINALEFSSSVENNHIFILCKNQIKYLIAFNCQTNVFYEIKGDKIEFENATIKSLYNLNDISKHVKVNTYKIDNDISLESSELYTKNHTSKKIDIAQICAYNFFECLKIEDFKTANTLMHDSLKNSISNTSLKNYFGNFKDIKLTNCNPTIFTLYYENQAKDFKILFLDNLIFEIEEI